MQPRPLNNFEIQKYCQNKPKCSGVYSRKNLSKIKNGIFIMNLDECESLETHRIILNANAENVTYFDSFRVEHVSEEIRKFSKNVIANTYRIQAYHSIMCEYFCIGFIDFTWKDENLLEYTNLFSAYNYKKNDKIRLKYLQ